MTCVHGVLAALIGGLAVVGFVVVGAALLKFALFILVKASDALKPNTNAADTAPKNQT